MGSADADARLDRCIGGKRIPPLAGRPGRLAARSLEAMARTGAGSTGLALAPREAEREKARPALPEKALCLGGTQAAESGDYGGGYPEHPWQRLGAQRPGPLSLGVAGRPEPPGARWGGAGAEFGRYREGTSILL